MAGASLARGFRAARREWRLVVVLWITSLVVGVAATIPAFAFWSGLVAVLPGTDALLDGIRLGPMVELVRAPNASGWRVVILSLLTVALLGRIMLAFVMGGMVEVLTSAERRRTIAAELPVAPAVAAPVAVREAVSEPVEELVGVGAPSGTGSAGGGFPPPTSVVMGSDVPAAADVVSPGDLVRNTDLAGPGTASSPLDREQGGEPPWPAAPRPARSVVTQPPTPDDRPMMHRFFRGAGRFFLRNLVMLIVGVLATIVTAGLVFALGRAAVEPLEDTLSAPLAWLRLLLPPAMAGLAMLFFLLVYDYSCIRLVCDDSRRPVRTWLSAVRFVGRRAPAALIIWLVPAAGLWILFAGYGALASALPATSGLGIAALVIVQQGFTLLRALLRTTTVAAEAQYAVARGFVRGA